MPNVMPRYRIYGSYTDDQLKRMGIHMDGDQATTRDNSPLSEGQQVAADVHKTVDHLRAGRATRTEAVDVKEAATRAIADHDASRAIGKL